MKPATGRKRRPRLVARFVAISWRDLAVSFGPILLIAVVAVWVAVRLIQPAPPSTLTISAGPEGSMLVIPVMALALLVIFLTLGMRGSQALDKQELCA